MTLSGKFRSQNKPETKTKSRSVSARLGSNNAVVLEQTKPPLASRRDLIFSSLANPSAEREAKAAADIRLY